tara:strand:- start:237 stop:527 length:291 start_codon:yes stop_codon:yes gene_type:complete
MMVVVTTDKRGVFAGNVADDVDGEWDGTSPVVLANARMCIYWSKETRGVTGLAAIGPQPGSRVGPPAPELRLNGVTSVAKCSEAAAKVWESEPWSA